MARTSRSSSRGSRRSNSTSRRSSEQKTGGSFILKLIKFCFKMAIVFAVLGGAAAGVGYWKLMQMVDARVVELSKVKIADKLTSESVVMFKQVQEGKEPGQIGIIFEDKHRQYIKYDDIPKPFRQALIATEDSRFYDHNGVDPTGIVSAVYRMGNTFVTTRKIDLQGASTITQQLVKNLFSRDERIEDGSYSKGLERFLEKGYEAVDAMALEKLYSKKQILEWYSNQFHVHSNGVGLVVAAKYYFNKTPKQLTPKECAFIVGTVKGPTDYNPFGSPNARAERRNAGLARTHTVIGRMLEDKLIPEAEAKALKSAELKFPEKPGKFQSDSSSELDMIADALEQEPIKSALEAAGITNPAAAGLQIYTTLRESAHLDALAALKGELVLLEQDLVPASDGKPVNGAVIVLYPDGTIEVLVGGRTGKDLNRVLSTRPPGSTMKPLVYLAYFTLNGSADDFLDNRVQGFYYSGQWYWPRKDHESDGLVGMFEALARSENLTAVHVLYHLLSWLTPEQKQQLAEKLDMLPRDGEGQKDYKTRMEKMGVNLHGNAGSDSLNTGVYWEARRQVALELKEAGANAEAIELMRLPYGGKAFNAERNMVVSGKRKLPEKRDNADEVRAEALAFLDTTFLNLEGTPSAPSQEVPAAEQPAAPEAPASEEPKAQEEKEKPKKRGLFDRIFGGRQAQGAEVEGDATPVAVAQAEDRWASEPAAVAPAEAASAQAEGTTEAAPAVEVAPSSIIRPETLRRVREVMNTIIAERGLTQKRIYDPERIIFEREFLVRMALEYVCQFGKAVGIDSQLQRTLSFPLGSSDITLLDSARMYRTLTTGQVAVNAEGTPLSIGEMLISEIKDASGNTVWKPTISQQQLIDVKTASTMAHLLTGPFAHERGTAKTQKDAIVLDGARLPLCGKTGTTSGPTTASFAGCVPSVHEKAEQVSVNDSHVIVAYVGHENGKSALKRRSGVAYSAASVALPVWKGTAQGIALADLNEHRLKAGKPALQALPTPAAITREIPLELPDGSVGSPSPLERKFAPIIPKILPPETETPNQ